jgi:tetratricopeptide (TPR) repeat protein
MSQATWMSVIQTACDELAAAGTPAGSFVETAGSVAPEQARSEEGARDEQPRLAEPASVDRQKKVRVSQKRLAHIRIEPRPFSGHRRRRRRAMLVAVGLVVAIVLVGAGLSNRQRHEAEDVLNRRIQTVRALSGAHYPLNQGRWDSAQVLLSGLLRRLRDEPRRDDQRALALGLLQQGESGREARGRHQRFLELQKEARFHRNPPAGLSPAANEEMTRQSAREALDLFAARGSDGSWELTPLADTFSADERAEIIDGCYELLLVLADGADSPGEGLRLLQQAAKLRPAPMHAYYLRQAACLLRQGDAAGAERARSEARQLEPSSALDHFLTGEEHYRSGDLVTARQHFAAALRLQPDHFWAHYLAACCYLQMNRPEEALLELNACLKREPDFVWLSILRGYTQGLVVMREQDLAAGRDRSQTSTPGGHEARPFQDAEADFDKAWKRLQERPGDETELRYALYLIRGLAWFQRRHLSRAAADLNAAIAVDDSDFHAFVVLASLEQDEGNLAAAIAHYTRAIEVHPKFGPQYRAGTDIYLGLMNMTPAQRRRALTDLDRATAQAAPGDPAVARDQTNRARLLHLEGRDPEALEACRAAMTIAPDSAAAYQVWVKIHLDQKHHGAVLDACKALLARDRALPELCELGLLVTVSRGDHAAAIRALTNALGSRPDDLALLTRRGWLYLSAASPERALPDFDRSIELDPTSADAFAGRGFARVALGDSCAAVADAASALSLGVPTSRLAYSAARIYSQAALAVAAETRRPGRDAALLAHRYQDRAVELATEAVRLTPPERRADFWRNQIQAERDFQAIIPRLTFRE